jgi:NADP-dependent alcohol dehydrogenase
MENFVFHNPVKIIFGKGEIAKIKELIPPNKKVMLTYGGGSIMRNGVYDQVKNAVEGIDIIEFSGIEANPRYETLMKAIDIVKSKKIDFLLSVGGGSVLDGTKFIAAGALWEGTSPWDILAKRHEVSVEKALPIGAVLTLPATGSEMNGNAVITRAETEEKLAFSSPMVLPQFSILDPEVVFSLPDKQVANGIIDAFIHVMEQYLTYPINSPIQDRFAEGILQTLVEEGPKVLANRNDYEPAANYMWAATMALNGLIATGVPQDWSTHMIGHELTAFHGLDHAVTLAIVLPGIMHVKRDNKKAKIIQYGERIWGITEGSDNEIIDATISKTVNLFESLGVKTHFTDYNIGQATIDKIVDRFNKRGWNALGEKGDLTLEEIKEALESRL